LVFSHTGYGVGLYQSARLAMQSGYRLALAENTIGNVYFTLSAEPAAEAQQLSFHAVLPKALRPRPSVKISA